MSEKFTNYYIETLTGTLHDALGKNIVFQAQSRVDREEVEELKRLLEQKSNETSSSGQTHERLQNMIEALNSQVEKLSREKSSFENLVSEKDNIIFNLSNDMDTSNQKISDLESQINNKDKELQSISSDFEVKINKKDKELQSLTSKYESEKVMPKKQDKTNKKIIIAKEQTKEEISSDDTF